MLSFVVMPLNNATFWNVRDQRPWQDAVWNVLTEMLDMPYREVQIAALHGIGHDVDAKADAVDQIISAFIRRLGKKDEELENYAQAVRRGCVQ